MTYLQSTSIVSHGFLSTLTCLVDSRFVVKVTDYGITMLRQPALYFRANAVEDGELVKLLLWRAPELLRVEMPRHGTQVSYNMLVF